MYNLYDIIKFNFNILEKYIIFLWTEMVDCHQNNNIFMMYISHYCRSHYHGGHNENVTLLYHPAVLSPCTCTTVPFMFMRRRGAVHTNNQSTIVQLYTYLLSFSDNLGRVSWGRDVGWSLGGLLHYFPEEPVVCDVIINYYHCRLFVRRPRVNRLISVFIMHRGHRFIAWHII